MNPIKLQFNQNDTVLGSGVCFTITFPRVREVRSLGASKIFLGSHRIEEKLLQSSSFLPSSSNSNSKSISMATSLISSLSTPSSLARQLGPSIEFPNSSFLHGTKLFCEPSSFLALSGRERPTSRRFFVSPSAKSLDHIPKQFREQNLKDGCESCLSLQFSCFHFNGALVSYSKYYPCYFDFGVDLLQFWSNILTGFVPLSQIGVYLVAEKRHEKSGWE